MWGREWEGELGWARVWGRQILRRLKKRNAGKSSTHQGKGILMIGRNRTNLIQGLKGDGGKGGFLRSPSPRRGGEKKGQITDNSMGNTPRRSSKNHALH